MICPIDNITLYCNTLRSYQQLLSFTFSLDICFHKRDFTLEKNKGYKDFTIG